MIFVGFLGLFFGGFPDQNIAIAKNYVTVARRILNNNVNPLFNFWKEKKGGGRGGGGGGRRADSQELSHHLIFALTLPNT